MPANLGTEVEVPLIFAIAFIVKESLLDPVASVVPSTLNTKDPDILLMYIKCSLLSVRNAVELREPTRFGA